MTFVLKRSDTATPVKLVGVAEQIQVVTCFQSEKQFQFFFRNGFQLGVPCFVDFFV